MSAWRRTGRGSPSPCPRPSSPPAARWTSRPGPPERLQRRRRAIRCRMIQNRLTRRHALALSGGLAALGLTGLPARAAAQSEDWTALGADVKAEFKWAWDHYVDKAWGK